MTSVNEDDIKIIDNRTLYIFSGSATQEQVEAIFEELFKKLNMKGTFTVNIVYGQDVKPKGFGYVHVSNPKFYNMAVGLNPDGSDRIIKKTAANWSPPKVPIEVASREIYAKFRENERSLAEEAKGDKYSEDQYQEALKVLRRIKDDQLDQLVQEYERPCQYIELPSLIKKEWLEYYNEDDDCYDHLEINRCIIYLPGDMDDDDINQRLANTNTLISKDVPKWVTVADIEKLLAPFTMSRRVINKGSHKGQHFPMINIAYNEKYDSRSIYIRFDPWTFDAEFTLFMIKISKITGPKGQEHTLKFSVKRKNLRRSSNTSA